MTKSLLRSISYWSNAVFYMLRHTHWEWLWMATCPVHYGCWSFPIGQKGRH